MPLIPHHLIRVQDDFNDLPDDAEFHFIIFMSSLLSFGILLILIAAVYYTFTSGSLSGLFGDSPYSSDSQLHIPDSFTYNEESLKEDELIYLPEMSAGEQEEYLLAKQFFQRHPPRLNYMGTAYGITDELLLRDRGLHAFSFLPWRDQMNDMENYDEEATASTPLLAVPRANYGSLSLNQIPYYIEDKTDIVFRTAQTSSTILNYPMPIKNRNNDCVYFEAKLYDFDSESTLVSMGLSTSPYPNFRLPGYNFYSIAVETSGYLRINKPFPQQSTCPVILPQLLEGDVIGFGFKSSTGTVFVTHNGKKILEVIKNLKMDLYPCIGSTGAPCKVQVNLGQLGFVFIEANAKKLGFCEGNNEGTLGAPPLYNEVAGVNAKENTDVILEQGERLPPEYPEWEETFFGPPTRKEVIPIEGSSRSWGSPASKPPSYKGGSPPGSSA